MNSGARTSAAAGARLLAGLVWAMATLLACGKETARDETRPDASAPPSRSGGGFAGTSTAPVSPPLPSDRHALLIGIGRYPNPNEDLPGPATDVRNVRDLLVDVYGFPAANVDTLTNDRATRGNIITGIRSAFARSGPNGLVLIYYSGHGLKLDRNYSVQDREPSGGDQALKVWGDGGKATIFLDDELGFLLRQKKVAHVVVLLDACFSGTGTRRFVLGGGPKRAGRVEPQFVNKATTFDPSAPDLVMPAGFLSDGERADDPALSSMPYLMLAATEESARAFGAEDWPAPGESHSVFTYYLVDALRRAAAQDTPRRLVAAVSASIQGASPCVKYTACQSPQIAGELQDAGVMNLLGARQAAGMPADLRLGGEPPRRPSAVPARRTAHAGGG